MSEAIIRQLSKLQVLLYFFNPIVYTFFGLATFVHVIKSQTYKFPSITAIEDEYEYSSAGTAPTKVQPEFFNWSYITPIPSQNVSQ